MGKKEKSPPKRLYVNPNKKKQKKKIGEGKKERGRLDLSSLGRFSSSSGRKKKRLSLGGKGEG